MESARAIPAHLVRTIRRLPSRQWVGGIPAAAAQCVQTCALGAGANGDPRIRPNLFAGAWLHRYRPRRSARCTLGALGDGGGGKMLRPLRSNRRIVRRPGHARFHRDPAACRRFGAIGRAVLACAARRHCEPQRSADAVANRERAVPAESAGYASAWNACLGRRAVPRPERRSGTLDRRS